MGPDDYAALVLHVFQQYLTLMRKLQIKFLLEPAGSHGVWGLDDYHFLPFYFGSAQLFGIFFFFFFYSLFLFLKIQSIDHKHLKPKSIHSDEILQAYKGKYMYLSCIAFNNSIKTESLAWHSPMINDISGVKTWRKVNEGMRKMFVAEVLGKLPIMQHFLFGSILPFTAVSTNATALEGVYAMGQERPVCCGMRIPSAIAAAQQQGRIPFD